MDNYIEQASRTCANDATNYLDRIDRTEFDRVFTGFFAASQAAEKLKKQIYYGRELSNIPTIDPATRNCPYDAESLHANLGIMGESHELVQANTREEVCDEGGDLLWYIAKKFKRHGVTFEEAMEKNIEKLRARYPDRFSEEIARNLTSSVNS